MDGLSLDDGASVGARQPEAGRRTPHAMFKPTGSVDRPIPRPRIWPTIPALAVFYMVAVVLATWPFCLSCLDTLPAPGDSSQHLWIMSWNKSCLLAGKAPFFCASLQYPVGAPLGLFSPLHIQSALFVPLSMATGNDVLSYNIIWMIGMVTTGLSIFVLARQVTGHTSASAIGGLLGMLSGPVMLHAHAHLELHFIGTMALFLAAWFRLLDRPGRGTLAAATASFVLMGASAAYFIVLSVVPAAWIAAYRLVQVARQDGKAEAIKRLKWLTGFAVVTLPFVGLLLSNQIWAMAHGFVMTRSKADFVSMFSSAPLWGYFVPSNYHTLYRYLMPFDAWAAVGNPSGYYVIERASYLGIATLLLLHSALIRRAGLKDRALWWSLLVILVVLGLGCYAHLGPHEVSLPTMWLWQTFPPFKLLRLPARFNLLAAIPAAVLAAAGLAHLLNGMRRPIARWSLLAAVTVVAILDLGMLPYRDMYRLPSMPPAYTWLKQNHPGTTLFEWPIMGPATADRTYWQIAHGCPTSEGYSGVNNMDYVHRISVLAPLVPVWRPDFLTTAAPESFGPIKGVDFNDYLWLFLKANGYRHLVLHNEFGTASGHPASLIRLKQHLLGAKVFEDDRATVWEQARLPLPQRPVVACTEGWKTSAGFGFPAAYGVGQVGRMTLYNPTPGAYLFFAIDAAAIRKARQVRLMAGQAELASWTIEPGAPASHRSPPLRLPVGIQELTLVSDAVNQPTGPSDSLDEAKTPYSLRVEAIGVWSTSP